MELQCSLLFEGRAMVVAVQPSVECTVIFTVCIVWHCPPPCAVQCSAVQCSAAQRSTEPSVSTWDRTATTDMVKSPLTEPRRSLESRLICLNAIQWEDQRSFSTGLNSLRSSRQWAIMIDMTPGGKVVDFWWSYPLLLRGDYSLQYPSVKGYPRGRKYSREVFFAWWQRLIIY